MPPEASIAAAAAEFVAAHGVDAAALPDIVSALEALASNSDTATAAGTDAVKNEGSDVTAQNTDGGAVGVRLSVFFDGREHSLVTSAGESAEAAARRWARDVGVGGDADVDVLLRELVARLRTAGARSDEPDSPLPEWGTPAVTRALVRVTVAGDSASSASLGPPHTAFRLAGETPADAARGFLSRMGLDTRESNIAALAARLEGGGEEGVDGSADSQRVSLTTPPADFFLEQPLPAGDGVSLNVTFGADGAPVQRTIHVRFGERVDAAVDVFLAHPSVAAELDAPARDTARATLIDALTARATAALSRAATEPAAKHATTATDGDLLAPRALLVPLAVGDRGAFDVEIPAGTSLRAASRVFCNEKFAAIEPAMRDALGRITDSPGAAGAATSIDALTTHATCRALVFDAFVAFARL